SARRLGLPVLRRRSGGLALVHLDGDLVWSVVLPRSDARVGRDFARAYGRLGRGPVALLRDIGIAAEWSEPLGLSREFCLLGPRGRVLTVGGRAIGGAAQHLSGSALLHQGMVSYRVDRGILAAVFGEEGRGFGPRITSLSEIGVAAPPPELGKRLLEHLAREL
ncbi:MAG TPA: hypothetical protein VLY85_01300, partial [Thermoplasmata archaeon]|nr:hypothetical protein [Thermoplasmata archaeon]